MSALPSDEDLNFAIQWLSEGYEGTDKDDPLLGSARRVAAWLDWAMKNRRAQRMVKKVAREHGVSRASARTVLKRLNMIEGGEDDGDS